MHSILEITRFLEWVGFLSFFRCWCCFVASMRFPFECEDENSELGKRNCFNLLKNGRIHSIRFVPIEFNKILYYGEDGLQFIRNVGSIYYWITWINFIFESGIASANQHTGIGCCRCCTLPYFCGRFLYVQSRNSMAGIRFKWIWKDNFLHGVGSPYSSDHFQIYNFGSHVISPTGTTDQYSYPISIHPSCWHSFSQFMRQLSCCCCVIKCVYSLIF